jgi:hypothetical protein
LQLFKAELALRHWLGLLFPPLQKQEHPAMGLEDAVLSVGKAIGGAAEAAETKAEAVAQDVVGAAKAVFSTVETDAIAVIGNLGHVRSILNSFSFSHEVEAAKVAVENAIINIARHIGG